MLRLIKWLFILPILAIIIAIPAILLGPKYIDWNKNKDTIEKIISEKSGYKVRLIGKLGLETLPKPRFSIDGLVVEAFNGEENLFEASNIEAVFSYKDLTKLGVRLEKFSMDEPKVYLHKDAEGVANWLPKRTKRNLRSSRPSLGPVRSLGDVTVSNGMLTYIDEEKSKVHKVQNANLSLSGKNLRSTNLVFKSLVDTVPFVMSGDLDLSSLRTIPAKVSASLENSKLTFDGYFDDLFVSGGIKGKVDFDGPDFLSTMYRFVEVPTEQKRMVFPIKFNGEVHIDDVQTRINDFTANLGEAEFTGLLAYEKSSRKNNRVTLNLKADAMDLNALNVCALAAPVSKSNNGKTKDQKHEWSEDVIDLTYLRQTDFNIEVLVGNLVCEHRKFDEAVLRLTSTRGVITLEDAKLVSGKGVSRIKGRLDATQPVRGNISLDIRNMPASSFMPAKQQDMVDVPVTVSGRVNFKGNSQKEWVQNLQGEIQIKANKGKLKGVSLKDLDVMFSILTGGRAAQSQTSDVDKYTGHFAIEQGVLSTIENTLESGDIRVVGDGKVDIANWAMNYKLTPTYKGRFGVILPISIRGNMSSPIIAPEVINSQNIGAAVGAVVGGPAGAAAGAVLGNILGGGASSSNNASGTQLPFDLKDEKNLEDNLKDFLGL